MEVNEWMKKSDKPMNEVRKEKIKRSNNNRACTIPKKREERG